MTDRALLYARVSGDDRGNEGRNLEGQIAMGREYARRKGYETVGELSEDESGASGAEINLPKLTEIRTMAQQGEFDVLIVREIDRLSRNLAKQLIIEEELRRAGVRIEYVIGEYPDTPEGDLMKHVRAAVSEYEREKIKERVGRGYRLKVQSGSVLVLGNNPPFGYRVKKDGARWRLEINEKEAATVKLIFDWFTMGDKSRIPLSIGRIVVKLSEAGLPSPADARGKRKNRPFGQWGRSSVANILKNETYSGLWRFGKRPQRTRRLPVAADETLAVEVPAVVSRETWQMAQARFAFNVEHAPRNVSHDYLMRRRVTCDCGLKMGCRTYRTKRSKLEATISYYCCPTSDPKLSIRKCDMPYFRADHLDLAIWAWIEHLVLDPDRLARGYADYVAEISRQNEPMLKRCEVIDGLLSEQRGQLERLLDLYVSGEFDRKHLLDRKMRLEHTLQALEKERDVMLRQVKQLALTEQDVKSLQDFGDRIRHALGSDALKTFEAKARIIEMLDVRARVAIEGDQRVAYASCAISEERLCVHDDLTLRGDQNSNGKGTSCFHDNPTVACALSVACKTR